VGDLILITGATGSQGGAVFRALRFRHHSIRVLVRDPVSDGARALAERGAELYPGDLGDNESIARAMTGARAAFAITVPNAADGELTQGRAVLAAAQATGLDHLVLASVARPARTVDIEHFASKAQVEREAKASGVSTTVVAPTWFLENLLASRAQILAGRLPLALPSSRTLQVVALADHGELVASLLLGEPAAPWRRVEIASDELSPSKMAEELTALLGRPVRHDFVPPASLEPTDLAALYAFLSTAGYQVDLPELHARFPAVQWHRFRNWAREQDWTGTGGSDCEPRRKPVGGPSRCRQAG
jgi:uncharacterized protein YbjT (DUF2867 family)